MADESLITVIKEDILSEDAQRVYNAIKYTNSEDAGAERLAMRFARAITRLDGGFLHQDQPLGAFLLYGSMHAPLLQYAEILTETWLGERTDSATVYTYIDCMATNTFSGMTNFTKILGPSEQHPGYPYMQHPLLHPVSLFGTDRAHRIGPKLNAAEKFRQTFFQKNQNFFMQLPEIVKMLEANPDQAQGHLMAMINNLQDTLNERMRKEIQRIYQEGEPYRAVVVFDNVESAAPDLLSEVINKIIHNGAIIVAGQEGPQRVSFASTIVVLLMHDSLNLLTSGEKIGFKTDANKEIKTKEGRGENAIYSDVREKLLNNPRFSTLMQNIADNMIVIGHREFRQQEMRVMRRLNELKQRLAQTKNIQLEWTQEFLSMLVQESFDKPVGFYTKRRTNSAFEKCVELPLARAVTQKQLRSNCSLMLTLTEQNSEATIATLTCEIGQGENTPLTAADIMKLLQQSLSKKENTESDTTDQKEIECLVKFQHELEAILEPIRIELKAIVKY